MSIDDLSVKDLLDLLYCGDSLTIRCSADDEDTFVIVWKNKGMGCPIEVDREVLVDDDTDGLDIALQLALNASTSMLEPGADDDVPDSDDDLM